jgi:hypothetical protein
MDPQLRAKEPIEWPKKIHNRELKRKKGGDNKIDRRLKEALRGQEAVTHEGKCLKSLFFYLFFPSPCRAASVPDETRIIATLTLDTE